MKIRNYKGYNIYYNAESKMFYCKSKKIISKCSSENMLISEIDNYLKNLQKSKEEKVKKAKEEAKKNKRLKALKNQIALISKYKYVFDIKEFYHVIKSCTEINSEITLNFTKSKLEITEMDPANVCMSHKELKYLNKTDKEIKIYLNILNLKQFLSKIKHKNELDITFSIDDKEKKYIHFSNGFGELVMPEIQDYKNDQKIPKLNFSTAFNITKKEFNQLVDCCYVFSDCIKIGVKNQKICIESGKQDNNQTYKKILNVLLDKPDDCNINFYTKYSIEYLKKFMFSTDKIKINLSEDYPLKVEDNKGNWYILAPR